MAILSKQMPMKLLASYLGNLYLNPIRTKSITAAIIALLGNYASQRIAGAKHLNTQTLTAFGLFGLFFGGTIPHFFYQILSHIVNEEAKTAPLQMLLIERFIFMPMYQFFSLYMISRLELKSHAQALGHTMRFFPKIFEANWKYLTVLQFINMYFVPPLLRVLVSNVIGFFWVIYLAQKRNPPPRKSERKP